MSQLFLILCSLFVLCATVSAQARVRCANSVQEYEERIRRQRQAMQTEAKIQAWGTNPETTKALLESYLNGRISSRELDLKVAVSIYPKNPDFLQIDLDARSIPISVPDGEANVTIEFKRSMRDPLNHTYTIPVCTGKLNKAYKQKPPEVSELRLNSFVAPSVTYTVPNVNILMNTDERQTGIDLIGEFAAQQAAQQEEAKLIKELAKEAFGELPANVPECQVDRNWNAADLVSRADAIVLAKAGRLMVAASRDAAQNQVEFEIMQVVKGDYSAPTLALLGDIRGAKVLSRDYVDCVPVTYAVGQEYLLFLKRVGEKMDLLWYPTAPVNQRVTNKNDTWVKEVGRLLPKTPKP